MRLPIDGNAITEAIAEFCCQLYRYGYIYQTVSSPKPVIRYEGQRLLIAWMTKETARTQVWLAKLLHIAQPSISAWVHGNSRPDQDIRQTLEVLTDGDVPADSWLNARERQRRKSALRSIEKHAKAAS